MKLDAQTILTLYKEAKTLRVPNENDWRMASAYCQPRHYASWQTDGAPTFGQNREAVRRIAYDTTGSRSLKKYVAVLNRIATPQGTKWHTLTATNRDLMKIMRVRAYFEEVTALLFSMRQISHARFGQMCDEVYGSIGTYGNGPMYLGQRKKDVIYRGPSFLYKALELRDMYCLYDDEGNPWIYFRRFYLNQRQFEMKFPNEPLPKCFGGGPHMVNAQTPPDMKEGNYKEFIHFVCPRDMKDFDPEAIDARRHPIVGRHIAVDDATFVGEEQGYRSFPYRMPRTFTTAGNPYGDSPAIEAIPALGSASAIKKTTIKQGQKAVEPTFLAYDDGVVNGQVDFRPNAVNYGGLDKQGRELIKPLHTGNFNVAENMLADERRDIEDSFFVTLFQILTENPEMTATEVMERAAEKAALLAPTMNRLQAEFLGPMVERELDLLQEMGLLPEMPPELIEAQGDYQILYTSPMAKSMRAEEVSGFMRSVEMSLNISQQTGDPSHLDHYNFDIAIPEIAETQAVPARWMNDKATRDAIAQQRNAKAQEAQMLQNAAPIASAMKTAADMGA